MNLGPHTLPLILPGDCRETLRTLPECCIQTCITSPPYHGLRDYGTGVWVGGDAGCDHRPGAPRDSRPSGGLTGGTATITEATISGPTCPKCGATRHDPGIGLEPTFDAHLAALVDVFREVRRVLRDDGTIFVNYGDRYNSGMTRPTFGDQAKANRGYEDHGHKQPQFDGLHAKNLLGLPWRVAFALQADGWILRSAIHWCKPNPMPESVRDRPTNAVEMLFLFSKSPRYFYDADAVRVGISASMIKRWGTNPTRTNTPRSDRTVLGESTCGTNPAGRNLWNYWLIPTEPTPEAHFATFPRKLVEPCILAGTSARGACADCGAPWVRVVERGQSTQTPNASDVRLGKQGGDKTNVYPVRYETTSTTTGWTPTCTCDTTETRPCIALDPFFGSGTVGHVAEHHGRLWVGCELSEDYIQIAKKRTRQQSLLTRMA